MWLIECYHDKQAAVAFLAVGNHSHMPGELQITALAHLAKILKAETL